jgi:hypothetical protein
MLSRRKSSGQFMVPFNILYKNKQSLKSHLMLKGGTYLTLFLYFESHEFSSKTIILMRIFVFCRFYRLSRLVDGSKLSNLIPR